MTTIKNMADLKAWLVGVPAAWPMTIAARAALRAFPALYSEISPIPRNSNWRNLFVLPVFRTLFISVFVAKHQNADVDIAIFRDSTINLTAFDHINSADSAYYTMLFSITKEIKRFEAAIHSASMVFNDKVIFWEALESDANSLQFGENIWAKPLWPTIKPINWVDDWVEFKEQLVYRAPYWAVLIRWYEECLYGDDIKDVLYKKCSPESEYEIIALSNDIWLSGKRTNQAIGAIQSKEWRGDEEGAPLDRPQIPAQKPAALEPVWVNNRLQLPGGASKADLASDPLSAALAALKLDLEALVSDAQTVSNIDQRFVGYLDHIAGIVPSFAPDQASLFRLGHAFEPIRLAQATVQAEWPDVLGFRFSGLLLAFERTLKQFPEWRQFTKIADDIHLTQAEIAAAPKLAEQLIEALREPEVADVVAPEIPNELEALVNGEIDPSWNGEFSTMSEQRAIDTIESSSNIIKRFLEPVFDGYKRNDKGKGGVRYAVGESIRTALQTEAENIGPALAKAAKRLLKTGGATGFLYFSQFVWLKPVLEFLKPHLGL